MPTARARKRFVLCVRNGGCEDLEPCKVYERLADRAAARDGYVRVIDESGEDYLYPGTYFVAVSVPNRVERALRRRRGVRGSALARRRRA